MAIETNKSLVQFGYAVNKDASTAAGFITFDSGKQAIFVGDGTEAKLVTPSVKNVDFNTSTNILTITKLNGDIQTLDFSDVASAQGVNSLLASLRTDINKNTGDISDISTRVNNLDASYKAADTSLQNAINLKADASTAALKSDVSALSNKFDTSYGELTTADASLRNDISALQQAVGTDGTVAGMIDNAIKALDSSKASNGGSYVAVDVSIVDGKLVEINVNDSSVETLVDNKINALDSSKLGEGNFVDVSVIIENGLLTSVSVDDDRLNSAITDINEEITDIKNGIAGGVHFKGVFEELPSVVEAGFEAGDIIIVAKPDAELAEPTKEYILVETRDIGPQWVELGDLNPSTEAITALEKKHDEHVEAINAYKVNGKAISTNPVLNGADVKLDGYSKGNDATNLKATDTINEALSKLEVKADAAAVSGVTSFGNKTGNITLQEHDFINGDVEFTLSEIADSGHELTGRVVGLGSAAFTEASAYDTAGSASKAYSDAVSTIKGSADDVWATEDETLYGLKNYVDDTITPNLIGDENNAAAEDETIYGAKAYAKSLLTWTVL